MENHFTKERNPGIVVHTLSVHLGCRGRQISRDLFYIASSRTTRATKTKREHVSKKQKTKKPKDFNMLYLLLTVL